MSILIPEVDLNVFLPAPLVAKLSLELFSPEYPSGSTSSPRLKISVSDVGSAAGDPLLLGFGGESGVSVTRCGVANPNPAITPLVGGHTAPIVCASNALACSTARCAWRRKLAWIRAAVDIVNAMPMQCV